LLGAAHDHQSLHAQPAQILGMAAANRAETNDGDREAR
jgi:hypothetical protein